MKETELVEQGERDMNGAMRIWELKDYAEKYGYNTGRFICINERGIAELKWLDAYMGIAQFVQPKIDGFIMLDQLLEIYGRDQEYLPTIGYDET